MTSNAFNSSQSQDPHLCYKSNCHSPLRIADILLRDDDEDGGGGMDGDKGWRGAGCGGGLEYSSPRRTVARWLKRLREKKGVVGSRKGKERIELGHGSVPTTCSTNGFTGGGALSSGFEKSNDGSEPSGSCRKETLFNLGVGFSLLCLIANSKNELSKMMELRAQMENFLQAAKEELRRKDALSNLPEPHDNAAHSITDIPEGLNSNSNLSLQFSATSYAIPESETILECDQSSRRNSPKPGYFVEGMNQLEAELEAELERLQIHLDTETLLEHPQLQRVKVNVRDIGLVESHSASSGEVDPQEAGTDEHYGGVSPYVLERRLHELLEARQEEHIQELEAALECYQHKLHEKELELSWWKDTVKLILQRIPGTSPHSPETCHLLR